VRDPWVRGGFRARKPLSLEPSTYTQHVLAHPAETDTLEKLEALSPWNVDLEQTLKNVS